MEKTDSRYSEFAMALTKSQSVLYTAIFLQVGDDDVARDILQDANLAIWKNLDHLDSIANFVPWAKTLAALEVRHYFTARRRDTAKVLFDSETSERLGEALQAPAEAKEHYDEIDYRALKACLGKLPPDKRELVLSRYWKEKSIEDLARRQAVPLSTLAMRLMRIRKELGDCVRSLLCRFGEGPAPKPDENAKAELFEGALSGDPRRRQELCRRMKEDPALFREWLEIGGVHAALAFNIEELHLAFTASHLAEARPGSVWPRLLKAAAVLTVCLAGLAGAVILTVSARRPAAKQAAALPPVERKLVSNAAPAVIAAPATKEGDSEMKQTNVTARLAAAVATVAVAVASAPATVRAMEAPAGQTAARVIIGPDIQTAYWQTAFTNRVPVCWEACPGAAFAELTATCMNREPVSASFESGNADAAWVIPADKDEDLYTLVLRYFNAQGSELMAVTSRVARVKGVNALTGPVDFVAEPIDNVSITSWNKVRRPGATTDNAVLAYDAADFGATGAVASVTFIATPKNDNALSRAQTVVGLSGYIGWKVTGEGLPNGWYTLEAAFDDGTLLTKDDYRSAGGTIYSFH